MQTGCSEPDADAIGYAGQRPAQTPASLICIWDGPDFGCELAAILGEEMSVLVIDADLLNPQADLLLGIESGLRHLPGRPLTARQSSGGLDQVLSEEQRGRLDVSLLNQLARPSRIRQVRLLSSQCGLDQYEYFQLDTFYAVLQRARLIHDAVIILCSQFVFDAFTCLCLQIADLILMPVKSC